MRLKLVYVCFVASEIIDHMGRATPSFATITSCISDSSCGDVSKHHLQSLVQVHALCETSVAYPVSCVNYRECMLGTRHSNKCK